MHSQLGDRLDRWGQSPQSARTPGLALDTWAHTSRCQQRHVSPLKERKLSAERARFGTSRIEGNPRASRGDPKPGFHEIQMDTAQMTAEGGKMAAWDGKKDTPWNEKDLREWSSNQRMMCRGTSMFVGAIWKSTGTQHDVPGARMSNKGARAVLGML